VSPVAAEEFELSTNRENGGTLTPANKESE